MPAYLRPTPLSKVNHVFAGGAATGLPGNDARKAAIKVNEFYQGLARQAVRAELARARAGADRARKMPVEKVKISDVVALTIDPVTGKFNPEKQSDVRLVQSWLKRHGHPGLEVDGLFGKQTFKALVTSMNRAQHAEQVAQVEHASRLFYQSGVLKRGAKPPPGFPLAKVPSPEELVGMVKGGGFASELVLRWINRQMRDDPVRFHELSVNFLERATHRAEPFRAQFLRYKPAELLQRYGYQAAAYLHAGSGAELRAALIEANAKQEASYKQMVRKKAKEGGGFWGDVLNAVTWPGEFVRSQIVGAGVGLGAGVGALARLNSSPSLIGPGQGFISPTALGVHGAAVLEEFKAAHPWWSFAVEMTVDPLNFVGAAALAIPAKGAWAGAKLLERAGIQLSSTGRIGVLPGMALAAPAKGGRFVWGTVDDWGHAVVGALEATTRFAPSELPIEIRFARRAFLTYKHATQLKKVVISTAHRTVRDASFRLFKGVTPAKLQARAGHIGTEFTDTNYKLGDMQAKIGSRVNVAGPQVRDLMFGRDVFPALRDERLSLVAREGGGKSRIGYQLWSRGREEGRILASHVVAWEEAHTYAMRQIEVKATHLFKRDPDGALRLTEPLPKELVPHYQEEFAVGYREALKKAGSYFEGGFDEVFDARTRQLRKLIYKRWDRSLALLQHELETHWEQAGQSLFDADGAWVGVGGDTEQMFREWGQEHYGELVKIDNPVAGRRFSEDEMRDRVSEEIERRQGIEMGRHEMMRESGDPVSETVLQARLDAIEENVYSAWQGFGTNGREWFQDVRRQVEVPKAHARVDRSIPEGQARGFLPGKTDFSPASSIDQEIRDAVRMMLGPFDPPELKALGRRLPGKKDLIKLDRSLNDFDETMSAAEEMALAQALYKHGLVLEAMRLAQNRLPRYIYKGLNGATQIWKFSTLALRPGWVVRNVVDNTVKSILEGVRNPAHFLSGAAQPGAHSGAVLKTTLDVGVGPLRETVKFLDGVFGTNAVASFDAAMETMWHGFEAKALQRVFALQGVPVPREVIEGSFGRFYGPGREVVGEGAVRSVGDAFGGQLAGAAAAGYYSKAVRFLWHITGEMPENYSRRVLYRATYARVLRETGDAHKAFEAGRDAVERTLFDYSKVTVIEDNFKLFFPFIQFWRKNTSFWIRNFVQHPAFLFGVARYQAELQERHEGLPDWMGRYVSLEGVSDVIAKVPGLGFLADAFNDFQTDPMNFASFAPLYRAFKNENPLLPGERAGLPFIGALIDAFNQWGLGLNPFFRKPLEILGVANLRVWQHIFPQTDLVKIFTKGYWSEMGLDLEALIADPIYETLGIETLSQLTRDSYNELIQREMAGQLARGETVSRERAQRQVDGFIQLQTLVGYFIGLYGRRNTPEDLYLYQLTENVREGNVEGMTDKDWDAYRTFQMRKADPVAFDRYIENLPLIQAYYHLDSFRAREQFKQENPEIIAWVQGRPGYRLPGPSFGRTLALVNDTRTAMELTDFLRDVGAPLELRKRMEAALITPQLRTFWARNDTPRKVRDKMLRGEFFRHVLGLQRAYFQIPETDFDARSGYLREHPELEHFWLMNNSTSDDFKAIIDSSNAALREHYFDIVERDGFETAASFLHRFPFIFEFTSASDKVDPNTGEWISRGGRGRNFAHGFGERHGLSQHAADYLAVKSLLDWFFGLNKAQQSDWLYGNSDGAKRVRSYFAKWGSGSGGGTEHARAYLKAKRYLDYFFQLRDHDKSAAYDWLDSNKEGAKLVREYFARYSKGGKSEHGKAYEKAKPWLRYYFALPEDKQREWLNGDSAGAKIVREYFDTWASHGPGKQAEHYRQVKKYLKHYYSLPKEQASDWLHGGSPGAIAVLGYFNQWSKLNQLSRRWGDYLRSHDPELNARLRFWQRYWLLPPDERPAFVMDHAAEAGVFVWGGTAADERHKADSEFLRKAMLHTHLDRRTVMYLRLRPYLDLLASLSGSDRNLFLKANPELREYLDLYGSGNVTGDKKLDSLIEQYFKLPSDSPQRSAFLKAHRNVQRYFDRRNPGDRAIHRLLEVYFDLKVGERREFAVKHPEISAYFEKRRQEADNERAVLATFEDADPRLKHSREVAQRDEQRLLDQLHRYQRYARLRAVRALEIERGTRR